MYGAQEPVVEEGVKAATARKLHAAAMVFWAAQFAVVWLLPSHARIAYLVLVSIYANLVGHWSAYAAERPTEIEA